ncbi:MAG: hypothetical protein ACRCTZ_01400 [Sarcina sp.]
MKKRSFKIMLYIAGVIMGLSTILILYKSNIYIYGLKKEGLDIAKEFIDVVNYYISTLAPFIFYTIVLFTLGYLVGNSKSNEVENCTEEQGEQNYKIQQSDSEIDELFNEIEV